MEALAILVHVMIITFAIMIFIIWITLVSPIEWIQGEKLLPKNKPQERTQLVEPAKQGMIMMMNEYSGDIGDCMAIMISSIIKSFTALFITKYVVNKRMSWTTA